MEIESDQLLLLTAVTSAITLLLGVLVIAVRTRQIREQLLELDSLKRSVQTVKSNLAEIVQIVGRISDGLPELSGLGLHFRQIRREQLRLLERFKMISTGMETLAGLLQRRDDIKKEDKDEIKEIVEASRSLQEWRSRMTAVYSDASQLFESEPVRELIDQFGPQPTNAAEPSGRSHGRTRPSQKGFTPSLRGNGAALRRDEKGKRDKKKKENILLDH